MNYWYVWLYTEKAMATQSSTLAWKIPWTEEPGRLQSMGSLRVGHDWATKPPPIIYAGLTRMFFLLFSRIFDPANICKESSSLWQYQKCFLLWEKQSFHKPSIDETPLVQLPTQFLQNKPFCFQIGRQNTKPLLFQASLCRRKTLVEFHYHLQILQIQWHSIY